MWLMLCTYCLPEFISDSGRRGRKKREKRKKKAEGNKRVGKKAALVPNGATARELSSQLSALSQLPQCCYS